MTSQADGKLSNFVFHKVDASHLEVDGLESITLKFRKATFEDRELMLARHRNGELEHIFPKEEQIDDSAIFGMVDLVYNFLSKESKKELAKIKLTDVTEAGEIVEVQKELNEKYKMLFISTLTDTAQIYSIFLSIHGLDIKDIDAIEKIASEVEKVKKKNRPVRMRR